MAKKRNDQTPRPAALKILNSCGIEVASGTSLGLAADAHDTPDCILEFVEASKIPVPTINLLEALPRRPLQRRLQAEGRLVEEENRNK
ncbi:MAG: hypothetical protein WA639_02685 [Candidatus Acidiferrum sp.]